MHALVFRGDYPPAYIRDFPACTGPGNLIRPIAPIVCSANHDARLPISAIQIRIKQYKFNTHLFWMTLVSISTPDYRLRGSFCRQ